MKKKFDFKILLIILLIIVLIVGWIILVKNDASIINYSKISNTESYSTISDQILSSTCEIKSALTENIELHATYYLKKSYVMENQEVKAGEKILKYTNGKYLKAPYDCVITKINIPDEKNQCTNEHYITIESTNILALKLSVDETIISKISVGKEAKVKISSLDDLEIDGYITKISNTASNGKFTVVVEFENNGEIKIGMTANVVI